MEHEYIYEPITSREPAERYILDVLPGTMEMGARLATLSPLQTRAPEPAINFSDSENDED